MPEQHAFPPNNGGLQQAPIDPAAQACVQLLESVLQSARNGEIHSVCVVACGKGGFGASFAGPDASNLNMGLDSAKKAILEAVTAPQKRSPIIRARMG